MIRTMLANDRSLIRAGLKRLIEDENRISVDAESSSGENAIQIVRKLRIDVAVVDTGIKNPGILETVRRLRRADSRLKILALGNPNCGPLPSRILEFAGTGYLSKNAEGVEIRRAIEKLAVGKRYVCAEVAERLVLSAFDGALDPMGVLSARELSVMLMLSEGHPRDEISNRLCISPKTVSTYRSRLMQKLGVRNDVDLAHLALRHGLVETQVRA